MDRLRALSPRAEKTIRLFSVCFVAFCLGVPAVALDSEPLAYTALGVVAAAILAGPVIERLRRVEETSRG